MNILQSTQRRVGTLLLAAAAAAGLLLSFMIPGFMPWAPDAAAAAETEAKAQCQTTYFALNPDDPTQANPNKETPGAVGPAVTQRDEAGIKAELTERRSCGTDGQFDPTLTASHYADWSANNLTTRKVAYTDIDAFSAEMVADPTLYAAALAELESLENGSSFSIGTVSKGVWSIYMIPSGTTGTVFTQQGQTQNDGTAAKFTHPSGAVIEYRLECGFQIVNPEPFPGPEDCTIYCAPPPPVTPPTSTPPTDTPPTDEPPKVCPPDMPHGEWPNCKDDPSEDPYVQGNAPVGGGLNADPGPGVYIPPAQMQQPPATTYTPPPAPAPVVPATPPSGGSGPAPAAPTPDPAPAPPAETTAPQPSTPETGCDDSIPGVVC